MKQKKTILYYLACMSTCLLFYTTMHAQPGCSQWDWCRHNVEIKNSSCCTVEVWCQEIGCDGKDYFMGHLDPGKTFTGQPSAYGAKFKVAHEGYFQHEFPNLDIDGYCNSYNFEYKGSNGACSKPSIQTNGDQTICKGQSVEICANGADNYWWSNGKDKRCITVSPDHTKTYNVIGKKNGCEASTDVTVHVNESFNLQTDGDQTVCQGQSVKICANGADRYWWSNGEDKRCITVSPHETTNYDVIGVKNGCEATGHVKVIVNEKFRMPSSDDQTICAGQSVEICGKNANHYQWNTGKESACITVSPHETTTYTLVGTKNGCKDTDKITVHVNGSFNLQTSDDQTICVGQSIEICANGADRYWWSNGKDKRCITVSPHETTNYDVIGVKNGCETTGHVKVIVNEKFRMPSSDDQTICAGQAVEICASDASNYLWDSGEKSACIKVSPSHTKTYAVTGHKNGCKDTDHITVNVNESFNLQTNGDQTICTGQTVEICANGADGYWWSNGKEKKCIAVSPSHTKTYSVTGIKNGCEGHAEVTVQVNESFNLQTSGDKTIHPGESVEICANGADGYWWNNGKEKACIHVSPHETTTYSVKGIKNGCEGFGEVTVHVNQVNNTCSIDGIRLEEWSIGSDKAVIAWTEYSNAWYTLYARVAGDHDWYKFETDNASVELNHLMSCTTYEWAISVKCSNGIVSDVCDIRSFTTKGHCGYDRLSEPKEISVNQSIDETYNPITVYPNPATDILSVNYNDMSVDKLSIFNAAGKMIEQINVDDSGIATIKVKEYTSGIYVIMVQANDKLYKNVFVVD